MRCALAVLALLTGLVGCTLRTPDPGNGPPPTREWQPAQAPRAQLLAVHGFGDHKGNLAEFADFAASQGIFVHAFDQRGFGEQLDRGFWPSRRALTRQLAEQITARRRERPDLPLWLLGDSMGAAVATLALTDDNAPVVDGFILVAPAVWGGETLSPVYRASLRLIANTVPWLRLSGRGLPYRASDNIEALRARGRDPLFIKEPLAITVAGLVELMDEARARAPQLRGPLLILIGSRDQIVPPAAQRSFATRICEADCTVVEYPEGWHLLLSDLQRTRVWQDITFWILHRQLPTDSTRPCASVADSGHTSASAKAETGQ